jgi:PAS domain S-box-containing protein
MIRLLRINVPSNVSGLAQLRRQLLHLVLAGLAMVLVIGISLWAIFGGRTGDLPVMQANSWFIAGAAFLGLSISYALSRWLRYEAGAILLLLLIIVFLFLVDYPDKLSRGRGLLLAAIPIILSAAILPSYTTPIVGGIITALTISFSWGVVHQAPDYLGVLGLVIVTAISWIGSLGLEASIQALANNLLARQGAQEALRRRLAMEHLLGQLSTRLIALHPDKIPDEMNWALQAIGQYLTADRCYISLLSAGGDITSHVYEWHDQQVSSLNNPTRIRALDSLIWARVRFKGAEGLAIEDVSQLEGVSDIERATWAGLGVSSVLAMPMVLQQTLLGFIACNSERAARAWTDDEERLLQLAAGILANVLARGRAEAGLQQSEERLKLALAGADLGMYDWNLNTDVLFADERYLGMLGYKPNELHLTVQSYLDLIHPDDRDLLDRVLIKQRKVSDRVGEVEYRMRCKDGEYHWILDRGRTIRRASDNEPVRVAGTHLDITQRKRMEEEIRAAEIRYRNLVEHLPAIVYLTKGARTIYMSPQVDQMLGYTQDECLMNPFQWQEIIHPQDLPGVLQSFSERSSNLPINLEYRAYRKDGRMIWVHDESNLILDEVGNPDYVQGIIQDITARVEADQAILESQANLMLAQQIAGVGGWSLEVATGTVNISEDLFRTLNTTDKTDLPVYPDTLKLYIHPDNWPQFHAAVESALAGGPDVDQEVGMLMPGDIPFYVHMKSISIRDEQDRVVRLVGMIQDVSARVASEDAYKENRANLLLAQEIARIGTWNMEISTGLVSVSEQLFRILGISDWENIPMRPGDLKDWVHPADWPRFLASIDAAIAGGPDINLEIRLQLDERSYYTHVKSLSQRDADGKVIRLFGMIQDVTDRKQAELALQESRSNLSLVQEMARVGGWSLEVGSGNIILSDEVLRLYHLTRRIPVYCTEVDVKRLIHIDDWPAVSAAVQEALLEGTPIDAEARVIMADRSLRYTHIKGLAQKDEDGQVVRIVGMAQDVTERKMAEQEMREGRTNLVMAQELARVGGWTYDIASGRLSMSDEVFRIFNTPVGFDIPTDPKDLQKLIHPDDIMPVWNAVSKALLDGTDIDFDARLYLFGGDMRYIQIRSWTQKDAKNRAIRLVGMVQDITEFKMIEHTLRESGQLLNMAQELAHVGSWSVNMATGSVKWSEEMYRIFARDRSLGEPAFPDGYIPMIHPDDWPRIMQMVQNGANLGDDLETNLRLLWPDGSTHYIVVRAHTEQTENGQIHLVVGIVQDITTQMQSEMALLESQRLAAISQELTHIGSWVYSIPTGQAVWSNEMYHLLGRDPALGPARFPEGLRHILHSADWTRLHELEKRVAQSGEKFEFILSFRRNDGQWRRGISKITVQRAENGLVVRVLGTLQDTTDINLEEL